MVAEDMAGNVAERITVDNITFDSTGPKIEILSPNSSIFTNQLTVDYSLDEQLQSAKIIIERTGGPNDSSSPHEISLIDEYLTPTSKASIDINQQINLVSNAVYRVSIEGVDIAGNTGMSNVIENITFDDIPPEISIISPEVDAFINAPRLGLRTNETLKIASVDWVWLEGTGDSKNQHTSKLVGGTLDEGEYPQVKFNPEPSLISGAWYSVIFNGTDRAGNPSSYNHGRLFFDNTPPEVSGLYPKTDSFINVPELSYSLNEDLIEGSVVWSPIEGNEIVKIDLLSNELLTGTFCIGTLTGQTDLADGIVYNLEISIKDKALNETNITLAENITFDITKPEFTQVSPIASSRVNKQTVSWNVNENLQSGKYTWIHMGLSLIHI